MHNYFSSGKAEMYLCVLSWGLPPKCHIQLELECVCSRLSPQVRFEEKKCKKSWRIRTFFLLLVLGMDTRTLHILSTAVPLNLYLLSNLKIFKRTSLQVEESLATLLELHLLWKFTCAKKFGWLVARGRGIFLTSDFNVTNEIQVPSWLGDVSSS